MDHSLITDIATLEEVKYVTFNQGRTILKVLKDNITGTLFNCMPCDVFPNNPGYQEVSIEEVRPFVKESTYQKLINHTFGEDTSEQFFKYFTL